MDDISPIFRQAARAQFADIGDRRVSEFGGRVLLYRLVAKALPQLAQENGQINQAIDSLVDQVGAGRLKSDAAASQFIHLVELMCNPGIASTTHQTVNS